MLDCRLHDLSVDFQVDYLHVDWFVDLWVLQVSFEKFGFGQGLTVAGVHGDNHCLQSVAGIGGVVRGGLAELVVADAGSAVRIDRVVRLGAYESGVLPAVSDAVQRLPHCALF